MKNRGKALRNAKIYVTKVYILEKSTFFGKIDEKSKKSLKINRKCAKIQKNSQKSKLFSKNKTKFRF